MPRTLLVAALALALLMGVAQSLEHPVLARGVEAPQLDWQATSSQMASEIAGLHREVAELKSALRQLRQDYAGHVHSYRAPGGEVRQTSTPLAGHP